MIREMFAKQRWQEAEKRKKRKKRDKPPLI
jgi:hypothetical protein